MQTKHQNKMAKLQILEKPPGSSAFGGIQTFAGLGPENEKQLFKICSFRYMGAAEYEQGASPTIMYHIAKNRNIYQLCERIILGKQFYFIVPSNKLQDYIIKLEKLCEDNYSHEWHGLKDVIEGKDDKIKGWIDIDEKVIFFIDGEMAQKMDAFLHIEE